MGPAEIAHRVVEQWRLSRLRAAHGGGWPALPAELSFSAGERELLPVLPWDEPALQAQAAEVLDGVWPALGYAWRWTGDGRAWRRAPDTGREWPAAFFGSIDYRAGNPHGDARVMWEPARLQQLVSLALLARRLPRPGAERAIDLLEDQLLSFVASHPPWSGVHYVSAMECALRIIAVCHAVDLARGRLRRPAQVFAATAQLVASHAAFISQRLSLYSSAGNHTIAEAAGLVYAGLLFPELPPAGGWAERGMALLAAEASRQVLDDGGGAEQAPWYLLLVADLAGLVIALADQQGAPVPAALRARCSLARSYLGAFAARPDDLPSIGDRDDGYALSSLLRLSFPERDASFVRTFPRTGQTRVHVSAAALDLVFDHGPLGMPPACGHGHADALSLCLRRHGRDVLLDTGTFTYTGDPLWRGYFRSTAAHNTVTVDGADQAVQETAFMWSRPYQVRLVRAEQHEGAFRCLARHDGYARLDGKVMHWRGLTINSAGCLLVFDHLDGSGTHDVELRWHAGSAVHRGGGTWQLEEDMLLTLAGADLPAALSGSASPLGGWRSDLYGHRLPATTISVTYSGPLPHEFVTCVAPRGCAWTDDESSRELEIFRAWVRQP